MRRLWIVCMVSALSILPAFAQDSYPKFEVFGGYSYTNTGLTATRSNANGFGFSVTGNADNHVGVTADFGFQFGSQSVPIAIIAISPPPCGLTLPPCPTQKVSFNMQQFLFGPTVAERKGRTTLFAHSLFGSTRSPGGVGGKSVNFAMGFGGGLDMALSDRLAIRWFQVDYLPTHTQFQWAHDVRFETGIVFRFGGGR